MTKTRDEPETPTPEATGQPTETATATPTPASTRTPRPTTTPPTAGILFCEIEQDGLVGFLRYIKPQPSQCSDTGFVVDRLPADVEANLAVGDFVPRCLQPIADEGMRILVGHVCVNDDHPRTFTDDPRPAELVGLFEDGDLIPNCAYEFAAYPDYPITVGPPCILRGTGPASISVDSADIEAAADCTAGHTYLDLSAATLRNLLEALPTSVESDANNPAVAVGRASLTEDPSPEATEALRTEITDAINFYTAGRGC